MNVPASAVDEVQIVRDFNEAHTRLHQATREQAALTKLATVVIAQVSGLFLQVKVTHEIRSSETQGFCLGHHVIPHRTVLRHARSQRLQQLLPHARALGIHEGWPGESRGARVGVGEIDIARLRAQETRTTAHIRIADQHVGRHLAAGRAAFVSNDGADAWVDGIAGNHAPRVHDVRGESVLVDDLVIHRAHDGHVFHDLRRVAQMLAHLHARHGRFDGLIHGARELRRALAIA